VFFKEEISSVDFKPALPARKGNLKFVKREREGEGCITLRMGFRDIGKDSFLHGANFPQEKATIHHRKDLSSPGGSTADR